MKPVFSFVCSREHGWILGEANEAVVSGPLLSKMLRGPSLRLSHLVFALFYLKADEPLWSRKLWSKSYVFQNKAKICAKGDPLITLMCRQRTTQNQITSNNLQCEMDFHAEANFQTK